VEYQDQYHETILNQLQERPFIAGSAAWIMYDFPSETRNDTRPWVNEKGLVDRHRRPKEAFYLYKAWLSDKPVVHIVSHDWMHRTVPYSMHDQTTFEEKIQVYSNLSEVKLFLNGHALGTMRPKNHVAVWSVPMKIGENQLLAEGKAKGKVFSDVVTVQLSFSGDFNPDTRQVNRLFVNAGAHVQFYPESGAIWEADQPYQGHAWGYTGGTEKLNSDNILGTTNDPVYQYYRIGMKQYHFDLPQGAYQVTIYLAEPEFGIKGKRVFSVDANGIPVFTHVDLAGTYGKDVPVKRSVILDVNNSNGITITFDATKGDAIVNGIEIKRL
jgi:beta-galactosidase